MTIPDRGFITVTRRSSTLVITLALACLLSPRLSAEVRFDTYTLETGEVVGQTLLPVFRQDRNADLVLALVTEDERRVLRVYSATGDTYGASRAEYPLPRDIVSLDVAHINGQDELVALSRRKLWRYDIDTGKRESLADISTLYGSPFRTSLPKLGLFRDLNGDKQDDLIVPDFDGYQVLIQGKDGRFLPPVLLPVRPVGEISDGLDPWYQPRQTFHRDMNADGREDLAFWNEGAFLVYPQLKDGTFNPIQQVITPGIKLDFGSTNEFGMAMQHVDQSNHFSRTLLGLSDINGDGVADLLVQTVSSQSVFRKKTTFEVYLGTGVDGQLHLPAEAAAIIASDGFQFDMSPEDFDQDNRMDMVSSSVRIGFRNILKALVTGGVDIELAVYRLNDEGYPETPDLTRKVTARFDISSGDFFMPTVLFLDVTGDGLKDLLVQDSEDELQVYPGLPGSKLFADKPFEVQARMPREPELIESADLNRDGKQDLLLRHVSPTETDRVVIMIAR